MAYVVSFEDFVPPVRFDGQPWTQVRIEEAADKAGPFQPLETIELDPVDTDPTQPQPRSFTTELATLEQGWYQVVFLDADGAEQPAEPLFNSASRTNFLPGVGDVAALLRTRTRAGAVEVGTFTAETRPTRDQVERLIAKAAGQVTQRLGDELPPPLWESASEAIALRTAMLVELSYFGDQISVSRGPYTELKALYKDAYGALVDASLRLGADQQAGGADDLSPAGGVATATASCDVGPDWMDW